MITAEAIRSRLAWAEDITDEESAERFAVILAEELKQIPEDEPGRFQKAIRRALRELRADAWRSACMAFVGADCGVIST